MYLAVSAVTNQAHGVSHYSVVPSHFAPTVRLMVANELRDVP
jgi:hypothetical protein